MSASEIQAYLWGSRIASEGWKAGDQASDVITEEIDGATLDVLEAAIKLGSDQFAFWTLRGAQDWLRDHLNEA